MNINPKTVRIIGFPLMYFLAFYSFSGSSVFGYVRNLAGSGLKAFIIVNAAVVLFILSARLLNYKTDALLYAIIFLFLLPPVLSHSKFDLIEVVLDIKLKDNHSVLITALSVVFVTTGVILLNRLTRFCQESEKWYQNGAEYKDTLDMYKRRLEMLIFSVALVLIPLVLIIFAGFTITLAINKPVESLILVILGTALAASGFFFLVYANSVKKKE
jgi:hypothetical protein